MDSGIQATRKKDIVNAERAIINATNQLAVFVIEQGHRRTKPTNPSSYSEVQ